MKRNRTNRFGLALLGCVTAMALFVAPASGGEIDDIKAQIKALMNRLEGIEAREKMMKADMKAAAEAVKTKAVATGDFPGSWKMPGSNTSVSFSGYVKLDAIYDFDQDLGDTFFGYDWGGGASPIKLDGDDSGNRNFSMHAKQTRLRFDSLTPTKMGNLKTRIETDFLFAPNALRLRHAYASLGGVLVGQNWSILGDENTYADTIDAEGPVGVASIRRPQVRYTSVHGEESHRPGCARGSRRSDYFDGRREDVLSGSDSEPSGGSAPENELGRHQRVGRPRAGSLRRWRDWKKISRSPPSTSALTSA